uniref:SERTA domain-containing protein n=1 Tax=Oncorhynchus mykiss TaxID=8022 RepID=A0A8K9Y6J1_ONCMY
SDGATEAHDHYNDSQPQRPQPRFLQDVSIPSKVSYNLQRQSIFNISLMKLYNHWLLSLERRVLINNMLSSLLLPPSDTLCPTLGDIEQHCPLSATPQTIITRTTTAANTIKTTTFPTASAEPLQTPSTITTTAKGQFKDCIRTGSPTLDGPVSLLDSRSIESRLMDTLPPPLPLSPPSGLDLNSSPSFSSSSSSGFFTDLAMDEILFADIDTSMYDFDTCTTPAAPSVMPSQPFNMDLTELDHIMEVLVGS